MMSTQREIAEIEVLDHGIDWPDYFQGAGVTFTEFDDIATGCGDTPAEAIQDALEQIAMRGDVDATTIESLVVDDVGDIDALDSPSASASVEPDAPEESFSLHHGAFCGMQTEIESGESRADIRQTCAAKLREYRRDGYIVTTLTRGESWEIGEPDGCAMVPDDCGIMSIVDDTPEAQEIDDWPNYYVSIRWKYSE